MRKAIQSLSSGASSEERKTASPVEVGSNGLPVPSQAYLHSRNLVMCPTLGGCGGSGWDPNDPDGKRWCPACGGYKALFNGGWKKHKPARGVTARRMAPSKVLVLRELNCVLADYPKSGTPEWDAWVLEFNQRLKDIGARSKKGAPEPSPAEDDPSLDAPTSRGAAVD